MELQEIQIQAIGPGLHEHNMRCAICWDNHAVFTSPEMIFLPCWDCQKKGWRLVKAVGIIERLRGWLELKPQE